MKIPFQRSGLSGPGRLTMFKKVLYDVAEMNQSKLNKFKIRMKTLSPLFKVDFNFTILIDEDDPRIMIDGSYEQLVYRFYEGVGTPLGKAIYLKNAPAVRYMLKKGCFIYETSEEQIFAKDCDNREIINMFMETHNPINLAKACIYRNPIMIQYFIENGHDINDHHIGDGFAQVESLLFAVVDEFWEEYDTDEMNDPDIAYKFIACLDILIRNGARINEKKNFKSYRLLNTNEDDRFSSNLNPIKSEYREFCKAVERNEISWDDEFVLENYIRYLPHLTDLDFNHPDNLNCYDLFEYCFDHDLRIICKYLFDMWVPENKIEEYFVRFFKRNTRFIFKEICC